MRGFETIVIAILMSFTLSCAVLTSEEFYALFDLYTSTNGENWNWSEPPSEYGYPWNFTIPSPGEVNTTADNPCSISLPWQGVTCSSGCFSDDEVDCHVISLNLQELHMVGTIPASISNLTYLQLFDLTNNILYGYPPWESMTSSFPYLMNISIGRNFLRGTLPESLGRWKSLTYLNMERNLFHGSIPDAIGNELNELRYLGLSRNFFNSSIPESLCNSTKLFHFGLFRNHLKGPIPACMGTMNTLTYLLINSNFLSSTIPASLGNLSNLFHLDLSGNHLTGSLPDTLQYLSNLHLLDLDTNRLEGTLPEWIGKLSNLEFLDLDSNSFEGKLPDSFGNLKELRYADINYNKLTGQLPDIFQDLVHLHGAYFNDNLFSGTIPTSLNHCNFSNLLLYNNLLTGTIPSALSNLSILFNFYIDHNELTGSIPNSFVNLSDIARFYVHNNQLTGTIPQFRDNPNITLWYLNVQNNYFTGNVLTAVNCSTCNQLLTSNNSFHGKFPSVPDDGSELTMFPQMESLDLSNNMFSGSIPSHSLFGELPLEILYLNGNQFTGSIPDSLFVSEVLAFAVLSLNCFTGTIPSSICNPLGIQQILLDGLHSASSCVERAIPFIDTSGVVVLGGVHGHIPSCLFDLPELLILHVGGNALSGTLPNVRRSLGNESYRYDSNDDIEMRIRLPLLEFIASSNRLSGTVPDSIWYSNITNLDLSFNHLHGTLPNSMLPHIISADTDDSLIVIDGRRYNRTSQSYLSLQLHVNKLSGSIPQKFRNLENINILDGNIFECNTDRSDLPIHDPNYHSFNCGSDATNFALIAFLVSGSVVIVSTWFILRCNRVSESDSEPSREKESYSNSIIFRYWWNRYYLGFKQNTDSQLSVTTKDKDCLEDTPKVNVLTQSTDIDTDGKLSQNQYQIVEVERVLLWISNLNIMIGSFVIFCSLLIFSILHVFFSSYTYTYVWAVTSIYMQGVAPAVLIFLLLLTLLGLIMNKLVPYLSPIGLMHMCSIAKQTIAPRTEPIEQQGARTASTMAIRSSTMTARAISTATVVEETKTETITWRQYFWTTTVFFFNIVVVGGVNGSYIAAVRSGYNYQDLIFISFALSVFKVLWNYIMLGGWESETLQQLETKLTDKAILWLCIFNNLLAPLFAEALVSSDCFVYLISQAPQLVFYYTNYACESLIFDGFLVQVCNVGLLTILEQSHATTSQIKFVPPFHYSFECSFELLSDYVYVFVFRYLLCGIVEPLLVMVLKWLVSPGRRSAEMSSSSSTTKPSPSSFQVMKKAWLTQLVPMLWKVDVSVQHIKQHSDDESDSRMKVIVDGDSLRSMERWMSHKDKMKRKLAIRVVTDFSLLLAFGVLCPPLGFVIALSIMKDCWEVRLALGRLLHIMDVIRDAKSSDVCVEENGEVVTETSQAMLLERIESVYKKIEQEVLDAETIICDGVWYGLCVAVWIWAFVLFDTLSPAVGMTNSVGIVVLMIMSPYLCRYIQSSAIMLRDRKQGELDGMSSSSEVHNVMLEMKPSPSIISNE